MVTATTGVDATLLERLFEAQRANQYHVAESTAAERIQKLRKLAGAVMRHQKEIREALYKDYKRPAAEVDLVEIFPITSKIKHARRHLRRWMAPHKVATPLHMFGSSSWVQYEPKGVCLIMGPWNYPIQLVLGPLISAIAAGNTAFIKPSEITPHSSAVVKKIVSEVFDENEVTVVEGEVDTATALLRLPFHHIFFTGSPEIGKIVMASASKNLASVTLELGGKSPTIIDETADLEKAALRVASIKFQNNGQICLAPDYVLIHETRKKEFIDAMSRQLSKFYGKDPAASGSYMRMVNRRNFERVSNYLEDSLNAGATVAYGGQTDEKQNYLAPTLVVDVPLDSPLMQNEIFGPVLPVIGFRDLGEAIDLIRSKEKPLALYIYSKSKSNINRILKSTRAGGTCINHSAIHFFNPNLPFGGSNYSGTGKTHGRYGFISFANERAVYRQVLPTLLDKLVPPYSNSKLNLIDRIVRWF